MFFLSYVSVFSSPKEETQFDQIRFVGLSTFSILVIRPTNFSFKNISSTNLILTTCIDQSTTFHGLRKQKKLFSISHPCVVSTTAATQFHTRTYLHRTVLKCNQNLIKYCQNSGYLKQVFVNTFRRKEISNTQLIASENPCNNCFKQTYCNRSL